MSIPTIIKYSNFTIDPRNGSKTYWFTVKLQGMEYTSIDVGFSAEGKHVSGSKTFFELDAKVREEIVEQTRGMVPMVVS